jgi:hypothetical protein
VEHFRLALTIKLVSNCSDTVSHKGIEANEDKIKVIRDMPFSKTVQKTKAILGLGSYFRRYINDYSKIVYPISCLVHKDTIADGVG